MPAVVPRGSKADRMESVRVSPANQQKEMRMQLRLKNYLWAGFLLTTALFLGGADGSGCGGKNVFESMSDDNTTEAKIEKARIAIDKKEYADAIQTLEGLCGTVLTAPTCNPEITSLYASAYAGRAGLDVFQLISEGAKRPAGPDSSFTLFSSHYAASIDIADMDSALTLLKSIPLTSPRTPDQGLQLALTATSHLVITLGGLTGGYDPVTGKPNTIPGPANIPQAAAAIPAVQTDVGLMGTGLTESGIGGEQLGSHITQIQNSLNTTDPNAVITFLGSIQ